MAETFKLEKIGPGHASSVSKFLRENAPRDAEWRVRAEGSGVAVWLSGSRSAAVSNLIGKRYSAISYMMPQGGVVVRITHRKLVVDGEW